VIPTVIDSADIDHEPVILTYRRAEPAPETVFESEVREPASQAAPPAAPAVEPEDPRRALAEFVVEGCKTNLDFHRRLLSNADFVSGRMDTHLVESMSG